VALNVGSSLVGSSALIVRSTLSPVSFVWSVVLIVIGEETFQLIVRTAECVPSLAVTIT
jgi:hypothetical protein